MNELWQYASERMVSITPPCLPYCSPRAPTNRRKQWHDRTGIPSDAHDITYPPCLASNKLPLTALHAPPSSTHPAPSIMYDTHQSGKDVDTRGSREDKQDGL